MRKTRLYLDTSPIIMVGPDQDLWRQAITQEFFRIVAERPDEYELFISPVTSGELGKAKSAEKRAFSAEFVESLNPIDLPQSQEAEELAQIYIAEDVLGSQHLDDLRHVAYAVVGRCDYIISWNMRHLVNPRTVSRVNDVNVRNNYAKIIIVTPTFFTGEPNDGK